MAKRENSLEDKRRFIAGQREKGLCLECKNTVENGRARCQSCLDRRNNKRREAKEKASQTGTCIYCLKHPAITNQDACQMCYCRRISYAAFGTTTLWQELLNKWEQQGGKCALSGVAMTLGTDAELDHIVPTSRGGSAGIENTQWVLMVCNRMKDNLTEGELFGLVERIYHTMKASREASP